MTDPLHRHSGSVPTPYYQDEWATIYHGDCREILPHLSADVVLTDPPYGIGVDYGTSFDDTPEYVAEVVDEALPLMRSAAPVVALTCGVNNIWRYPPPTWVLAWYQTNATGGRGKWGFSVWQPVLVYGTDPYLRRQLGFRPDLIATSAPSSGDDKRLGHPCPKPVESWTKILARVSPVEADVVLDPLMGSGTSVVAAKYTGRRSIGIDIEERYCEIAARRLGQQVFDLGEAA